MKFFFSFFSFCIFLYLFIKSFLWVETGVPGVKPPEPVIEVERHQCLTHKVVHLLVYSHSLVCVRILFKLLPVACGKPNHHWAQIWSSPVSVFSLK